MRIEMTKTEKGATDGITIQEYGKGNIYTVSEELGLAFIKMGVAKQVIEVVETAKPEKKQVEVVDNKAIKEAPENKSAVKEDKKKKKEDKNDKEYM